MKLLKSALLGLTLGLLYSGSVWAESATNLAARDIRAAAKTLTTEVKLYHYFDIHKADQEETQIRLRSEAGRRYILTDRILFATKRFWDPKRGYTGLFAGEGLYLALDPEISESYGKTMIEMTAKAQTKYLDFARGVYLTSETLKAIYKEGILELEAGDELPESMRLSEMTLSMMVRPGKEKFRQLIYDILKRENINMIEYTWRSSLDVICAPGSSQSAFIYIGTDSTFPEFKSLQMVSIQEPIAKARLGKAEKDALERTQKFLSLIKLNINSDTVAQQQQNAASLYRNPSELKTILNETFGCL